MNAPAPHGTREDERGMALLVVLLLVAIMATVAVGVLDDIRFGLHRSANAAAQAQARWYAIGAEAFAGLQIRRLAEARPDRMTLEGSWNGTERRFPIDGGSIAARLSDGGNCFNLNALQDASREASEDAGAAGAAPAEPFARRSFRALLTALEIGPRDVDALTDAITDWVDPDSARSGAGWEDDRYANRPTPYRTGGVPLAEVSELRAIEAVTPDLYARIRPFVCALPTTTPAKLNINTLGEDQALLLTAATLGAVSPGAARTLLAQRPEGGWASIEDFWTQTGLFASGAPAQAREMMDVRTRFFTLSTRVVYLEADIEASALLEQIGTDRTVTRLRRWTLDE